MPEDDYSEREMRLIHERDKALTDADQLRAGLLGTITWIEAMRVQGANYGFTANELEQFDANLVMWRAMLGDGKPSKPKAIITLTDGDEEGEVNCSIDFIPSIEKGGQGTPAQLHALDMLNSSLRMAKKHTQPKFREPRKKK